MKWCGIIYVGEVDIKNFKMRLLLCDVSRRILSCKLHSTATLHLPYH